MPNERYNQFGPWKPFPMPVVIPGAPINEGSMYSIEISEEWLPYVLGALKVLRQEQTWDTRDGDLLYWVRGQVDSLMGSIHEVLPVSDEPTGTVKMVAFSDVPDGWLPCDGTTVSRTTYADLFAVIGTSFGQGDGDTTFTLPYMVDRVPIGAGDLGGGGEVLIGDTGGEKTHALTVQELPSHHHSIYPHGTGSRYYLMYASNNAADVADNTVNSFDTGGGMAHNNMQPYVAFRFLIKT